MRWNELIWLITRSNLFSDLNKTKHCQRCWLVFSSRYIPIPLRFYHNWNCTRFAKGMMCHQVEIIGKYLCFLGIRNWHIFFNKLEKWKLILVQKFSILLIFYWSLWIGTSTCSCEQTLPETEPATSKGIIQAHGLQALKTLFGSKFSTGRQFVRVWKMQLCCIYVRITRLLSIFPP